MVHQIEIVDKTHSLVPHCSMVIDLGYYIEQFVVVLIAVEIKELGIIADMVVVVVDMVVVVVVVDNVVVRQQCLAIPNV